MLDDLVKVALVGTGRASADVPPPAGPLGDAVAAVAATDAEARLLGAVAVLSRYEACGRVPAPAPPLPSPAAADDRPACSPRALDLLARVLAEPPKIRQRLLAEWLAAAAGRRVPSPLIPSLLDAAVGDPAVRATLASAVGPRGAWLMALNPRWRAGLARPADAAAVWTTGTAGERAAALRHLRATDPPAAVGLVRSTWAEDAADERAAFIDAMAVGLGDADEPFLESALDDRSKQVRAAAVELLARLPASAFVRRMTDRADTMLAFADGQVVVTLPAAFDKSWERDGVTERPPPGRGERQGWLAQLVAAVPPAHWSAAWGVAPAAAVAALPAEFAELVIEAWATAAVRHPTAAWASALLADPSRHAPWRVWVEMLNNLTPTDRQAVARDILRSPGVASGMGQVLLMEASVPLDHETANVAIVAIERYTPGQAGQTNDYTGSMMGGFGLTAPPDLHDEVAERWAAAEWDRVRSSVDVCLARLRLRRDIQREFAQ